MPVSNENRGSLLATMADGPEALVLTFDHACPENSGSVMSLMINCRGFLLLHESDWKACYLRIGCVEVNMVPTLIDEATESEVWLAQSAAGTQSVWDDHESDSV